MKLRIVSWNIHKGIGGLDRKYSLERVVQTLAQLKPDVALLQEVADHWPPAGRDLQVQRLAEEVPLPYFAFSPEHRFREGGYGNCVLSRYPIKDQLRIDLTIGRRKQRSALMACIELPPDAPYPEMFATTLHLGLVERERRAQLRRLFEEESHHSPTAPSVLGGDFNDVFGTLEGRFMSQRGFYRMTERAPTFPAAFPFFSLDAIFGHQLRPVNNERPTAHPSRRASDHVPIVADVELGAFEGR